ncbi:MAG: hypothetical protein KDB80_10630 [Planctomycetes bacterium]|nr:hypothetical protein [Planctomycetota bacterium]
MNWAVRRRISNWAFGTLAVAPWLWLGILVAESEWLRRRTGDLQNQNVEAQTELDQQRELEPIVSPTQQRLELGKWRFEDRPSIARTMQVLESLAADASLTVHSIQTPPSGIEGTMLFDLDLTGSLHGICAWFQRIETDSRLLVIEAGKMFREPGQVRAHVRIATFHRSNAR